MDAAKSDGVPHAREYGLAFSRTVRTEESSFQSDLQIYDNGKDPVNVLYHFALLNRVMEHFYLMSALVLLHICEVLPCQRLDPLLFTDVLRDKDVMSLVRMYILRN